MYVTILGTKAYEHALNTDNPHIYTTIQGKSSYAKKNTEWVIINPNKSYIQRCTGY
jgi:hypothetical protein